MSLTSSSINLLVSQNPNKNMALATIRIYYTWKNIKSEYNNNRFKISAPTWNGEFNLLDGSYSVSDIQEYFEYIQDYSEYISFIEKWFTDQNNIPPEIEDNVYVTLIIGTA